MSCVPSTLLYYIVAERKTESSRAPFWLVSKLLFITENTRSAAAEDVIMVYAYLINLLFDGI